MFKVQFRNVNDAALFVTTCNNYNSDIDIRQRHYVIDAKSMLGILSMNLNLPFIVDIHTDSDIEIEEFHDAIKLWEVKN